MRDFHKEMLACQIGSKSIQNALELLRAALVYSMRVGDTFVINCEQLNPNFKWDWQSDEEMPFDDICDFDKWREEEEYMKIVRGSENRDLLGKPNMYVMQDSFTMCFLYKYKSDEQMIEVINNIPNSEKM